MTRRRGGRVCAAETSSPRSTTTRCRRRPIWSSSSPSRRSGRGSSLVSRAGGPIAPFLCRSRGIDPPALQPNLGDLGRRAEPHWWPPVTGAAADVDLRASAAMKPRHERLLEPDHEVERPHLTAVGVAGELETYPEGLGVEQRPRLVRQQHQLATGIAIVQGTPEGLLGRRPTVMNGRAIVDPGQIEANGPVANRYPLVAQYSNAQAIELVQPGFRTGEVFVIAGHEINAVRGLEPGQRLDCRSELSDRPINEISGDGDEVRRERVGARDDLFDERPTDGRPHVNIGELDDSKSVLRAWQAVESDAHPSHLDRFAHRSKGGRRQAGDQNSGHAGGQPGEQRSALRIEGWGRCDAPPDHRQQAQQIGRTDDREQQKHDTEPDITSPNESPAEIALSAPENQREGDARCEQREKRATDGYPGGRPAWIAYQSGPQIVMNAGEQSERDGNECKEATHHLVLTRTAGDSSLLPLHRRSFAASLRAQPGGEKWLERLIFRTSYSSSSIVCRH